MKNGSLVISLDFEQHWGVFDVMSVEDYKQNLEKVGEVILRLLDLSKEYKVNITFATVGFLFADSIEVLNKFSPNKKPSYLDSRLNPYSIFNKIGVNEKEDSFHYAKSIIEKIKRYSNHEIASHTFSHYYTLDKGQTKEQFNEDLKSAISIANDMDIEINSIVFPKNQVNDDYLKICKDHGINSYRGTENSYIYKSSESGENIVKRVIRLLDSYINITGYNTYKTIKRDTNNIANIPSSRFLRPYNHKLRLLEKIKLNRIYQSMEYAAKNNEVFHLWWHPHNFGDNIDVNFANLESIFIEYKKLNSKYDFTSKTMHQIESKT